MRGSAAFILMDITMNVIAETRRPTPDNIRAAIRAVRSLRYKRVTWERVNLAVAHYVEKRPLKMRPLIIDTPTLQELAIAYDVSAIDIQQKLDEQ